MNCFKYFSNLYCRLFYLYNKYTKIEWCKYNFKKKYKVEEYVPICIQKLDNNYITLFKLLFRRKSKNHICNKMNINKDTYDSTNIGDKYCE